MIIYIKKVPPMLRWILACAIVANLLFLAWSQYWLAPLGLAPLSNSEPERLGQQIAPEAVVLRKNAQSTPLKQPTVARNLPTPPAAASGVDATPSAPASVR